jgi:hypothetical protein
MQNSFEARRRGRFEKALFDITRIAGRANQIARQDGRIPIAMSILDLHGSADTIGVDDGIVQPVLSEVYKEIFFSLSGSKPKPAEDKRSDYWTPVARVRNVCREVHWLEFDQHAGQSMY